MCCEENVPSISPNEAKTGAYGSVKTKWDGKQKQRKPSLITWPPSGSINDLGLNDIPLGLASVEDGVAPFKPSTQATGESSQKGPESRKGKTAHSKCTGLCHHYWGEGLT